MGTFRKALFAAAVACLVTTPYAQPATQGESVRKPRTAVAVVPWVASLHFIIYEGYFGYLQAMRPLGPNPAGLGIFLAYPPKVILIRSRIYFPGWYQEEVRPEIYLDKRELRRI